MPKVGGNKVPEITGAEHISPEHTGDNISAKRVANYIWNGSTWERDTGGGSASSTFSTTTNSNVAGSATSVTLLAANAARLEATITNDSTAVLYIKEGSTASATDFKFRLEQYDVYRTNNYTGIITGIWASATGNARVSES